MNVRISRNTCRENNFLAPARKAAWDKVLLTRLDKFGIRLSSAEVVHCNLYLRLCLLDRSAALMLVQILVNSWATSARYPQQGVFGCLFGCCQLGLVLALAHRDELSHYLHCPILWRTIDLVCMQWSGDCLAHRLGVASRARDLRLPAVAYMTDHYVKHHHLNYYHHCVYMHEIVTEHRSLVQAARAAFDICFG